MSGQAVRAGVTLVTVGAVLWLLHGLFMLVGLVTVANVPTAQNLGDLIAKVVTTATMYAIALVTVLLAGFLVGLGVWRISQGSPGAPTRKWAAPTAWLFLLYGVLALLGLVAYVVLWSGAAGPDLNSVIVWGEAVLLAWSLSGFVLLIGGFTALAYFKGLAGGPAGFRPAVVLAYAIINLLGTLLLPTALLVPLVTAGAAASSDLLSVGVFFALLVVPILAIVLFALFMAQGLRLRRQPAAPMPSM